MCELIGSSQNRSLLLVAHLLGERGRIVEHFVDAAGLGIRSSVVKDAKQMAAPSRGRHQIPTFTGAGMAREGYLENRRRFPFGVHDGDRTRPGLRTPTA